MQVTQNDILALIDGSGVSVDISELGSDVSLRDAGLDSLDIMNIFLNIEEKYGIKLSDDDINSMDSLDNIVRYLQNLNPPT
jgi:acyl carrier protein